MKARPRIRFASRRDLPGVIALVRKLAEFEKLAPPEAAALRRYARHGFGRRRYFRILVAELDGGLVAYAFFFFAYSTFLGRPTLYLEDLFVLPEARRGGVGLRLMRELARIARREGCRRMDWTVLDWNVGAQRFYRRLGARPLKHWIYYRLDGTALARMSHQGSTPV